MKITGEKLFWALGFQFGLFNFTPGTENFEEKTSFQLGLLNYNSKSYIPWLPLVNWDMGR